jgi:hypothetical protein
MKEVIGEVEMSPGFEKLKVIAGSENTRIGSNYLFSKSDQPTPF